VATGLAARHFKEVTEMWKKLLDGLLASCVAADPMVYMYWLTWQREADEHREAAMVEKPSPSMAAVIRPIELARRSREAAS
jgi:uncharacterized protein involved in tolerance to divalent cations